MIDTRPPWCPSCGKLHDPALPCWRGRYSTRIRARVLRRAGRVCWICGGRASTVDHVIPRSRWGNDADENLRPCCASCNARRGNRENPFTPEPAAPPSGAGLSPPFRPGGFREHTDMG